MQNDSEGESPRKAGDSYDVYETNDGRVVVYDECNPDAYLRSDLTVAVEP